MAKLGYALDLRSNVLYGRAGSSPASRTGHYERITTIMLLNNMTSTNSVHNAL